MNFLKVAIFWGFTACIKHSLHHYASKECGNINELIYYLNKLNKSLKP